jgi:putative transposase
LKGTEDLGGGLSAVFRLENQFQLWTGKFENDSNQLFQRQPYVRLSSNQYGTATFGRQQTPFTSRRNARHRIWPYLLRGMTINQANQVWALDTSYIPTALGFVYLTAVVDWVSRKVLAHRVAITMEAMHAVKALEEAFAKYGQPEIVNTDQGSQFTATVFTAAVLSRGIRLSMDGKGAWRDNVSVEREWRSVKYVEVYLKTYESVGHARRSIGDYINLYNQRRPHSSLEGRTPDKAYVATLPAIKLAV